ncbi:MAG TPA: hypothetical protein VHA77_18345 [Xanthobacteraceae bacterium]|jgi:hypothetical protein|nr:hypothetical protein [Xanthobacteraceae bacterium]
MALDIDGFAVLKSIREHGMLFPGAAAEASKLARSLVTKQIRGKNASLSSIQEIRNAIGAEALNLVLDGMPDAQIKALAGKLDKYHPDLKTSNAQWRREHVQALVSGSVEPAAKPAPRPKRQQGKPARKAASDKNTGPALISFRSAGATRKR